VAGGDLLLLWNSISMSGGGSGCSGEGGVVQRHRIAVNSNPWASADSTHAQRARRDIARRRRRVGGRIGSARSRPRQRAALAPSSVGVQADGLRCMGAIGYNSDQPGANPADINDL
jgi:hypothetical protein